MGGSDHVMQLPIPYEPHPIIGCTNKQREGGRNGLPERTGEEHKSSRVPSRCQLPAGQVGKGVHPVCTEGVHQLPQRLHSNEGSSLLPRHA